jgi:hypothetical protein
MYATRKQCERGYMAAMNPYSRFTYSVEKGVTIGMSVEAINTAPASAPVMKADPNAGKRPATAADLERLKAEGKVPQHIYLANDPRFVKYQFLSPGGQKIAAQAIIKIKDGSFTYIGEVMEFLDRNKIEEQPPKLEEMFKEYFLRREGRELSEFIEI